MDHAEQHRIIQNANRRNRLRFGGDDIQEMVDAEHNLKDVKQLLTNLRTNGETLLHTAVFIELKAADMEKLRELQSDVMMELTRCKISVDRLTLRQLDGFLSVLPFGYNHFGSQYERVLPASSVANLYPFNYSGKTDPHGFYLGRDKFGTNILTDFDRRSDDKTNANVLILGNSGQGKSHLLKGILANLRESGKSLIVLDPEQEYQELCENLGGCYLDYLSGEYVINPLQPQNWDEDPVNEDDERTPEQRDAAPMSRFPNRGIIGKTNSNSRQDCRWTACGIYRCEPVRDRAQAREEADGGHALRDREGLASPGGTAAAPTAQAGGNRTNVTSGGFEFRPYGRLGSAAFCVFGV